MAQQIIWFADPRLIKLIFKDDELAGFLFAYPDVSAAIQRTGGRLWPLGWVDLLDRVAADKVAQRQRDGRPTALPRPGCDSPALLRALR